MKHILKIFVVLATMVGSCGAMETKEWSSKKYGNITVKKDAEGLSMSVWFEKECGSRDYKKLLCDLQEEINRRDVFLLFFPDSPTTTELKGTKQTGCFLRALEDAILDHTSSSAAVSEDEILDWVLYRFNEELEEMKEEEQIEKARELHSRQPFTPDCVDILSAIGKELWKEVVIFFKGGKKRAAVQARAPQSNGSLTMKRIELGDIEILSEGCRRD